VTEFKLPELGENISQGDLVRLMISPGASITEGQPVMELETDKAVVEVPSSVTGTIQEIRVKEGEKIKVGQVIFTFENGASAKAKTAEAPAPKAETPTPAPAAPKETAQPQAAPEARPTGDRRAAASVSASEFNPGRSGAADGCAGH
jgi:pyruvate dehydrogenase E2 component (dihydrolipoamide acetyltransferase)